jgi:hypothetical protein
MHSSLCPPCELHVHLILLDLIIHTKYKYPCDLAMGWMTEELSSIPARSRYVLILHSVRFQFDELIARLLIVMFLSVS